MNPTAYGCPDGQPLFYLHGVPGAAVEAAMLHQAALAHGIKLLVVERNLPGKLDSAAYLQQLAQQISDRAAGQPIRLLGFSIGACLALRVAALLGERVAEVYLLSAAAPLQIPSNSVGMGAGRYTFLWAQHYPRLFRAFAWYQALLAKVSPGLLLKLLFAGAGGKDPELLHHADTQAWLVDIQRACFKHGTRSYVRDVELYVETWATELDNVTAAVSLWHGEADNWAPIAMSIYLQEHLRHASAVSRGAEHAHYSCLLENAETVMATVQLNSSATRTAKS
ncbi:alpha/beta hydrolase [Pseudomonas sp. 1928-m]|uniref:alpha/beta fold hydrolase n=1 Tax=Pseudomonas sp. 1928-m TaxID=3033804 RepID=UPI0023DEE667|nr:alpha/beta hydrolase [Pseudomonas sp. 1928-m]MDF3195622.1 alpha/beta hydrolase [Pseudomonas sp. 1928-m]